MSRDVSDMVREAMPLAMDLVRRFEGLHLRPYLDPIGIPTIGYGTTIYPDGRRVTLADPPLTADEATILARWYLRSRCLPVVMRLCPEVDTPGRLAAILDWSFNLGAGRLAASTLRRKINAQQWDDVPVQLMRWVYAGGRQWPGLVRRRAAEAALI
jgi:lysozyme